MREMKKTLPHCRLLLALLTAAVGGCAVGPDYQRPALSAPGALTREPLAGTGPVGAVAPDWWKAFGSAELDALVSEALLHSPTIETAEATLRAAHQNVIAQRGFFFPSVQFNYNTTRQNTGKSLSSPLDSGATVYSYHTAQLSVNYAPDIFGANRRQVEALLAAEEGQRLQLQAARLTLAGNVSGAVLQIGALAEQISLTEQAFKTAQEQLRHMRRQQENGYAGGLEVATQQTLLIQLQQTLPPLQKQLEETRNLLATLVGRTPDAAIALPPLSAFHVPTPPAALPSALVEQRPDVRIAETNLQQANAAIGVAKAVRLPQLSLSAALGGGAIRFSDMFGASNRVWSAAAGLLQPIFEGGTLAARQRAAEAQREASAALYRSTVLSAFQDVANALYALDIDTRALRVTQEGERAARTTKDLTQSQLRAGYAAAPAALAAEQSWLQARAAQTAARGALLGDVVALYQALGGGVLAGAGTQAHEEATAQSR